MNPRLMFRGGVRSFSKKFEDGTEEKFFYKARTPNELAAHFGAEASMKDDADGSVSRQKHRARFIAESLCDEGGAPVMTAREAESILGAIKAELVNLIVVGSNDTGEAGKD